MNKDTLKFLTALTENNSKEWMDANRDWYQDTRKGFLVTVDSLLEELKKAAPGLDGLRPKDCVFRQNRDIRFSANKAPYKNNMGAYFSPGGKKSVGPGYYLHVQPGESFLAGGIWMPAAEELKKIRQEIDYAGAELQQIIEGPTFKSAFGEIHGERLKTSPRDYSADHPHIELLRLKSFVVTHPLSDEEVLSDKLVETCMQHFAKMTVFHAFLARAVDDAEGGEGII
ncbi:DUF2461 domain-containing protein [Echinicola vietnamensis]|uniref:TIGR02453 family protein n=1 Tax=Echinicola vietnamensis (strain DSM 17526 / LMG 23754 / KMM 6221) TaxID=926556 RepID=L0FW91_ECHVK|nr:DUF2461 domain-containing protein [Echinicola vietnamensis]AGA78169.1 TIGR02453 family protein [Echinicola vietnamensis DSM 17526]